MSLHTYFHPYEHQSQHDFHDISAGSINDFQFFNIDSGRQQKEFDGAKVSVQDFIIH